MDMCYDGTLAMPSSYVLMDEEEMMYVTGGVSTVSLRTAYSAKNVYKVYGDECVAGIVTGCMAGYVLGIFGTAVAGLSSYVFGNWANVFYDASSTAKRLMNKYGKNQKLKCTEKLSGLTLSIKMSLA